MENAMAAEILGSYGKEEPFLSPASHEDQRRNRSRELGILISARW